MTDLRSDTVTVPTEEMRAAIAAAPVGDDVYSEDPSVNMFQDYVAELLGKEAALWMPTGVMANQIALACHTERGDEVIVDSESHIFHYETAAASIISQLQLHPVASNYGIPDVAAIEQAIRPPAYYFPRTALVCMENTHNRYGGAVISAHHIARVRALCDSRGLPLHCDGARFWHACAALDVEPAALAADFDSVAVCFSKGLGAPMGSALVGTRTLIEKARKWRKILGGGTRQVGMMAAAGHHALVHHRAHIPRTHADALLFATVLRELAGEAAVPRLPESNIVAFNVPHGVSQESLVAAVLRRGVVVSASRPGTLRAVFHFQISTREARAAASAVAEAMQELQPA